MIGADYFAQDPSADKLHLTVGIYQDGQGKTPVLQAVKMVEQRLIETKFSKSYRALTGDPDNSSTLGTEIVGADNLDPFVAAQTAGGAVALRVMAELLAQISDPPPVWLQTPTCGTYIPILTAARLCPLYFETFDAG